MAWKGPNIPMPTNAYGKNDTPGVNQRLKISAVG